jgi:N-acetyl-1-D-myo-inositol-2-amino-2-deoxy-alpha-D-glucopyranoside deacetylase
MNPGPGDYRGRSLLAVFAHPDDESLACGGLLARCVRGGATVSLVCATRGGRGRVDSTPEEREQLRQVRTQELLEATQVLGVAEVRFLEYHDGFLPWAETARLEADIAGAVRRLRPDVVLTFGEDGLYWHPDHVAIHERTTAALAAVGDPAPALYYVTIPRGMMRQIADWYEERSGNASSSTLDQLFGVCNVDAFGVLADPPTLIVDVSEFAATKLAALLCHRSQPVHRAFSMMSDGDAVRFLSTEHFHRAAINRGAEAFIEDLAVRTAD